MKKKKSASTQRQQSRKKTNTRVEIDALGEIHVPKNAYYGSFTTRALANFNISGYKAPESFKQALGYIKLASAETNYDLKLLDKKRYTAISKAAKEFIDGIFDDQFQLDVFQAGAGTPFNMNANEIIANRANEILKKPKGSYSIVHPNNHVNMSQSSNDVIPTAMRIAVQTDAVELIIQLAKLKAALLKKTEKFKKIVKIGRTHLQDAVPVTLGQEFESYAIALGKDMKIFADAQHALREIGLGGTATGSGINTSPKYQQLVTKKLAALVDLPLTPTQNTFETTSNMNSFLNVSSALRPIALTFARIANDLKLLNMGPVGGISEITLPEVEPGSSIMPGKVNPSIPECIEMIAWQVIGNDTTIMHATARGQLELNVMTPVIMHNLLSSIQILTKGSEMFQNQCIDGIQANKKQINTLLENSLVAATALVPHLGYHETAMLVNKSLHTGTPLKTLVLETGTLSEKKLNTLLSPEGMTRPNL